MKDFNDPTEIKTFSLPTIPKRIVKQVPVTFNYEGEATLRCTPVACARHDCTGRHRARWCGDGPVHRRARTLARSHDSVSRRAAKSIRQDIPGLGGSHVSQR